MAYYRSKRSVKRLARKAKRNFAVTLILIAVLFFVTLQWILPTFITGIGFIKAVVKPASRYTDSVTENASLAPPVLNIPYEATNTAQIDIFGFSSPGSKVKLYVDDTEKQTIDVSPDGSFIIQNVTLSLGTNNIYGKTLDDQGKKSLPSKLIRLNFDNEKPGLTVNEPEDNKKIQEGDRKVKISGSTEIGAKILINGTQTIVDKDGKFSTDLSLNDGDNLISIKSRDLASNETEIQRKVTYTP